ncbi:MAG: NAD(P)H-binding protein [Deltaproteobacteria bacterium]|nr:NAD(P)H-binding protein [Deltaproteobacteria bacterium]
MSDNVHTVTGAFGYSGKYIAQRLLEQGKVVHTLTNSPDRRNPFDGKVIARRFDFDQPDKLTEALKGTRVLYNTYWVRFNHKGFYHSLAVENTMKLFAAAKQAGVERVIHVSITNPTLDSPLEYFSGKAKLEEDLKTSGLSYAILRPTVLFGKEDILINNIAWFLRRFFIFGVFGKGHYKLQPIYVDDFAELAVKQGQVAENVIIDAIGPETFTYRELVKAIARIIGKKRLVVSFPPLWGYWIGALVSRIKGDVTITREEIRGLMDNLLCTDSKTAGKTRLTDWAEKHKQTLGVHYANELARRKDLLRSYEEL